MKGIEKGDSNAIINLANIYARNKDFKNAEKYYLLGIEKENINALNGLAYLYFQQYQNPKKALELAIEAKQKDTNSLYVNHTLACIYLWQNEFEQSTTLAQSFLYEDICITNDNGEWHLYFLLLLAKSQYTFLYDYFNTPQAEELQIKDRLKPIYYALMYYMQDKYPNEYLRMGDELKETVEEIIDKVEEMRLAYAL